MTFENRYGRQSIGRAWAILLCAMLVTVPVLSQAVETAGSSPALRALAIGNGSYGHDPLTNPRNDAELMTRTLQQLGFSVTTAIDLNRQQLFSTVREFADKLPVGAVALVYYAGHGMQISGTNYLMPVDMVPTSAQGVAMKAFPLNNLLDRLAQSHSSVNLVIMDACRNNPFEPQQTARFRNYSQLGLAKISAPRGTLVAYSTSPGQLAEDGVGSRDSLYTATLVAEMRAPGRTIEEVLKRVADIVRKKSFDDQQPWFETSLVDDFYFQPPPGVRMVTAAPILHVADASSVRSARGIESSVKPHNSDWYMQLNESEWLNFDWEVGQRVKRLTEDEIPLLIHRANAGNVVAQTTLGIIYREGVHKTIEHDSGKTYRSDPSNVKSLQWLRKAAGAGFPMAQAELGEMYYQGHGVDRDLNESIRWLELAARARYTRARLDLAQVKTLTIPSAGSSQDMIREIGRSTKELLQQQTDYR